MFAEWIEHYNEIHHDLSCAQQGVQGVGCAGPSGGGGG